MSCCRTTRKGDEASIKTTAEKLHRAKILLDFEGVETKRYSKVKFHIKQIREPENKFEIHVRVLDEPLEPIDLFHLDLQRMESEGSTTFQVFEDRAKFDVVAFLKYLDKNFAS